MSHSLPLSAPVAASETFHAGADVSDSQAQALSSCLSSNGVATPVPPTPTPTSTPTGGPTPTPIPAPVTPTPAPVTAPLSLPTDCIVSLSQPGASDDQPAFNPMGTPHTVVFLCGHAAGSLGGPASAPYPTTGCFNVVGSVSDETTGGEATFTSATCAGQPAQVISGTVSCASVSAVPGNAVGPVANPICAAGYQLSPSGACVPCPSGLQVVGAECQGPPTSPSTCPAGSTAVTNVAGGIAYCHSPLLSATPTNANEATFTINPGAPHVYLIHVTGYVGTLPGGSCPSGTTLSTGVNLGSGIVGPACRFNLTVEKKYLETTSLEIIPIGQCGGAVSSTPGLASGGVTCLFRVRAIGMVILKTGVNCADEPSTGPFTSPPVIGPGHEPDESGIDEIQEPSSDELDEGVAEGPDPIPTTPSYYQCVDGSLMFFRGVPRLTIDLTAQGGVFSTPGTCFVPGEQPAQPTPTVTATSTPTPITRATLPGPTNTPVPVSGPPTATPAPVPTTAPVSPAFCFGVGVPTTQAVTGESGITGILANEIEIAAMPVDVAGNYDPFVPVTAAGAGTVRIQGRIFIDDLPQVGTRMSIQILFPDHTVTEQCGFTDADGRATCTYPPPGSTDLIGTPPPSGPDIVPVVVSFVFAGQYCQTTTYFVRGASGPSSIPPPPVVTHCNTNDTGIAVTSLGTGPITIVASLKGLVNTQPSLIATKTLGSFALPTPTTVPTSPPTATPVATSTQPPTSTPTPLPPAPTATPRPTATATSTPTPTATREPTATATASLPPPPPSKLDFSLDAARVGKPMAPEGIPRGLDTLRPNQKVWLEMFYSVRSIPKPLPRTTTYTIYSGSRTVFKAQFSGTQGVAELGSFIRYVPYIIPRVLAPGVYTFRARLQIGSVAQSRDWHFAVVRNVYLAQR